MRIAGATIMPANNVDPRRDENMIDIILQKK